MGTPEAFQHMVKGWDIARATAEADRCLLCHDPPCSRGCPAETDPGAFIRKLRLRNVTGAIRTIKSNNALGGACGVLCPSARLCEKECSATGISAPVKIAMIQRALVEHGWKIGFAPLRTPAGAVTNAGGRAAGGASEASGRAAGGALEVSARAAGATRVAVIGSGPAGLSCAAELAKGGFAVTVFEERAEPGGVIRYGVPSYRFDREFLDREMADIAALGVQFQCGKRMDGVAAERLLREGYQAVFVAPGLWSAERIPGGDAVRGVYSSVEFLSLLREERFADVGALVTGKTVAVIGGGSVAMDCVESACKMGARDAYLVYRRSFAQMPAEEEERLAALRLGVHFLLLNQPTGYAADAHGNLAGVRLVRTMLGEPDASGRRAPQEIRGSDWTLEAQVAVEAIGNRPDATAWGSVVKTDRHGLIITDKTTGKTSTRGIYAGGDIARGPALVVEAVQDGKLAARAIRAALS